jgi:hypothetical protein
MKILSNVSFDSGPKLICLGTIVANPNCIHKEVTRRLNSGNARYHTVLNVSYSRLLSKGNLQIKLHTSIILHVVSYGCETWAFAIWEDQRLKVFERRVLRRKFGPKRK